MSTPPPANPYGPNGQVPQNSQSTQFPAGAQYPGGAPTNFQPTPDPKKKSWFARHKIMTGLLGLVALGAIGSAMGGGSETKSDAGDTAVAAPTTAAAKVTTQAAAKPAEQIKTEEAKAQEASLPGMNEVVHYNTFDFTVTSLKCGISSVGNEYSKEKAQGEFCKVGLTVKNTGTKAQTFMADNQKLLDAKGTEYSYSTEATVAELMEGGDSDVWMKEINPGNAVKGVLIYDVPAGTKATKLHVSDGGFTDEGTDILLS